MFFLIPAFAYPVSAASAPIYQDGTDKGAESMQGLSLPSLDAQTGTVDMPPDLAFVRAGPKVLMVLNGHTVSPSPGQCSDVRAGAETVPVTDGDYCIVDGPALHLLVGADSVEVTLLESLLSGTAPSTDARAEGETDAMAPIADEGVGVSLPNVPGGADLLSRPVPWWVLALVAILLLLANIVALQAIRALRRAQVSVDLIIMLAALLVLLLAVFSQVADRTVQGRHIAQRLHADELCRLAAGKGMDVALAPNGTRTELSLPSTLRDGTPYTLHFRSEAHLVEVVWFSRDANRAHCAFPGAVAGNTTNVLSSANLTNIKGVVTVAPLQRAYSCAQWCALQGQGGSCKVSCAPGEGAAVAAAGFCGLQSCCCGGAP
ncbi:hypothetical protein AUJ68_06765 [Candidatus Woesearchaeota archaeon CG1_02_57_44]|nr:MAG: hypothetical protein AUJ68_06765 [Candidatus Woesearchaeota archaeon CG1_02_57_44]